MSKPRKKRKKKNSSKHDTLYTACLMMGLFLPIVLYLVLMLAVFGAPNSPWLILGLVGAFAIGAGMASVVFSVFWKLWKNVFHKFKETIDLTEFIISRRNHLSLLSHNS